MKHISVFFHVHFSDLWKINKVGIVSSFVLYFIVVKSATTILYSVQSMYKCQHLVKTHQTLKKKNQTVTVILYFFNILSTWVWGVGGCTFLCKVLWLFWFLVLLVGWFVLAWGFFGVGVFFHCFGFGVVFFFLVVGCLKTNDCFILLKLKNFG